MGKCSTSPGCVTHDPAAPHYPPAPHYPQRINSIDKGWMEFDPLILYSVANILSIVPEQDLYDYCTSSPINTTLFAFSQPFKKESSSFEKQKCFIWAENVHQDSFHVVSKV